MKLNELPRTKEKEKKRFGKGIGSGRGKTAGRGTKGQRARGKLPLLFEGSSRGAYIIKRLPFLRGKGKNKARGQKNLILNIKYLNLFPAGSVINKETLIKARLLKEDAKDLKIKILGDGELSVPLTVELSCSGGAKKKIEKAGGTVKQ